MPTFYGLTVSVVRFQSTLSLRRATRDAGIGELDFVISIHALLAESDLGILLELVVAMFISIHALLAESDNGYAVSRICHFVFQSTLSLRRATTAGIDIHPAEEISIHALLAESDDPSFTPSGAQHIFQSTLSLRRATRMDLL